jgi:hypothetical protein
MAVIEQRRVGREALFTDQFFVVELAVGAAMLGVPLRGDGSELPIERHGCSWVSRSGGDDPPN